MQRALAAVEEQQNQSVEQVFTDFLTLVMSATSLVEVNVAAGIAWQALQQVTG